MRCADASELMDAVLDNHANSELQATLLAHTADCAACRAEWVAIQSVDRMLTAAPPVSPPADFASKVMARLARRRPAQHPWAGALALFAGTVLLLCLALLSLIRVDFTAVSTAGLLGSGEGALLQLGGTLVHWVEAGWEIRQALLHLVPPGVIVLCALLSLVALVIWLGLIAGVQGALRSTGMRET